MTVPSSCLLEARHLAKVFYQPQPHLLFRDVSLRVDQGELVAIGGRSGEGKSTLLHILGTLEPPSEGSLLLMGRPSSEWRHAAWRNQKLGFIFQAFYLLEELTVLDNLLMPARIARQSTGRGSPARKRAYELLEKVGLERQPSHWVKQLSGGEKQRLALARALFNRPQLLLADEPTGNLDRENARQVQKLLFAFVEEEQSGLIVVSHDEELLARCSRRYELEAGALRAHCASPQQEKVTHVYPH